MRYTVTNQPKKGEVYYGIKLYMNNRCIGSHNGRKRTKRITWYVKDYIDWFLPELLEKCSPLGIEVKLQTKTY